jgi:hypothetical protein
MKLKQLVVLLVFAYSLWTSPVSANADEFIEWSGYTKYNGDTVVVGVNKYSGDRVYLINPGYTYAQMQVVPAK